MKPQFMENLILFLMILGLGVAIWLVLYHPEWLMFIVTYRGSR